MDKKSAEHSYVPMFDNEHVEINSQQNVYDGFFKLNKLQLTHSLFNGGDSELITRELLERGHAVAVLPYDPVEQKVLLIEQFRVGAMATKNSPWLLEIIAGMIDKDETIENVAHREAEEEAGLKINKLIPAHNYLSSPGGTTERIHIYIGLFDSNNIETGVFGLPCEGEDIKTHLFDYNELSALAADGHLDNAATLIAVQWLMLNKDSLINND